MDEAYWALESTTADWAGSAQLRRRPGAHERDPGQEGFYTSYRTFGPLHLGTSSEAQRKGLASINRAPVTKEPSTSPGPGRHHASSRRSIFLTRASVDKAGTGISNPARGAPGRAGGGGGGDPKILLPAQEAITRGLSYTALYPERADGYIYKVTEAQATAAVAVWQWGQGRLKQLEQASCIFEPPE